MKTGAFQRRVILLNDSFAEGGFPERFANEVYLSKTTFIETSYTSPFTVKYVHQGFDLYKVNGRPVALHQGCVMIANDGSEVELRASNRHSRCDFNIGMSLFLDPVLVKEVFYTRQYRGSQIAENNEDFETVLPLFYDDVIKHDHEFVAYIQGLYNYLIAHKTADLTEDFYYGVCEHVLAFQFKTSRLFEGISQKTLSARKEILKRVSVGKDIIDSLGARPFRLHDVAKEACLSKYFFIKCFRQVYGTTPQQYYIRRKIALGIEMLKNSKSVSEVAVSLDYPNVQCFSRQFRQVMGVAPTSYRKQYIAVS